MATYGKERSSGAALGAMQSPRSIVGASTPTTGGSSISKSITYNGTKSDRIFAVSSDVNDASVTEEMPNLVEVSNTSSAPIMLMVGYSSYSNDTTIVATDYLHVLLPPGGVFSAPVRAVISDNADKTIMFGTAIKNTAPNSNMYTDSGADTTEGFADDNDTTITFDDASGGVAHNMFKINDLIRLDNEVCRITSIVDTAGDGAYTPAHFVVDRAVHGTEKADHTNNTNIRFPFFNAYHNFDKYSVAQTDFDGKFKCYNMFGQGRATTGVQGIVAGSFALKFYNAGYQELGLSGITSSTETSLEASGSYWLKIALDGGTAESINFTVDSSNTNWGSTNGVISKIQTALDDKYNNSDSNTFQKKSTIGIVNGDIRFTSGQRLSTSAVALTAGADGASAAYNWFAQQNGHIPPLASLDAAVPARLPDDVLYDRVTYGTSTNPVFCWDDGYGNIIGVCQGTINYETGAIDITGAPANAEFVFTCLHTSAFAGKLNEATTSRINSLVDIYANTPSQVQDASVAVRVA